MGVKSTNVSLFLNFWRRSYILLKFESGSILKDGSRLAIKLTERKSYHVTRKVRAEASASFDDCQRLISSCPGELKGQ
jgi:hypothetical protein